MARKGEMWVFDSSCITQLQSQITTGSLAHNCITPVTQLSEHPNRLQRVVGSNPIEFPVGSKINSFHILPVHKTISDV